MYDAAKQKAPAGPEGPQPGANAGQQGALPKSKMREGGERRFRSVDDSNVITQIAQIYADDRFAQMTDCTDDRLRRS